jgi:hypothetical protein
VTIRWKPSLKDVVPPKARLRREVVQAAAGVEQWVGGCRRVKRECLRLTGDREEATVDAATYQHPGVGVVSVDRLTVEPALKCGSHPPALWWPAGGGRPWRVEVPSEMGLVQEGLCSETTLWLACNGATCRVVD